MKILVVGATGTIGKAVADRLAQSHDVVRVGYRDGDYKVDLGSKPSIQALFETVGPVDAVVMAIVDSWEIEGDEKYRKGETDA